MVACNPSPPQSSHYIKHCKSKPHRLLYDLSGFSSSLVETGLLFHKFFFSWCAVKSRMHMVPSDSDYGDFENFPNFRSGWENFSYLLCLSSPQPPVLFML